jgi:hypothetical protein
MKGASLLDLDAIKELWQEGKATYGRDDPYLWLRLASKVPTLIAEVERLRGLILDAHDAGGNGCEERACPFCPGQPIPITSRATVCHEGIYHYGDCIVAELLRTA